MTKQLFSFVSVLFALFVALDAYSQQTTPSTAPAKKSVPAKKPATAPPQAQQTKPQPTAVAASELTVDQVVQLIQAGLSEDLIIAKIKKNNKAFDLSTEQLLQLKKVGASNNIIRLLMNPTAQPVAPVAAPPATIPAITNPTPMAVNPSATSSTEAQQAATPYPDEQGIYWLKGGKELVRVEGVAVSNVRTGSTLVSSLTGGIKRARMNAQLKGARSELRIKERSPQFYFYLPENASIVDFLLLKVVQRLDVRQIEIGQKTFWKLQAGVDHAMQIEFSYKRIKSRLYLITLNHELEPGEYGFYGTAGISAIELKNTRVYDFGIDP